MIGASCPRAFGATHLTCQANASLSLNVVREVRFRTFVIDLRHICFWNLTFLVAYAHGHVWAG